jgi:hypothetical protein
MSVRPGLPWDWEVEWGHAVRLVGGVLGRGLSSGGSCMGNSKCTRKIQAGGLRVAPREARSCADHGGTVIYLLPRGLYEFGGQEVAHGFAAANELGVGAVDEDFGRTGTGVVVGG